MRLRTGLILACTLMLTLAASLVLPKSPPKVYAAANLDQLCVLSTKNIGGGIAPNGWFRAAFINRATIKVELVKTDRVSSDDCLSPAGLKFPFLHSNGKKFQDLAGGNFYDQNTNDSYDYRRSGGGGSRDESRIDQFSGPGPGDPFDGKDAELEGAQISNLVSTSEFTFGIEEDNVGSNVTCGSTNENFTIHADEDHWFCSDDVGGVRGYRIGSNFSGLDNFNITYNYQDGKVVHVSDGVRGERTFTWCEGASQFRSENCSGDLYFDSATEEQMANLKEGRGRFLLRKDGDSRSFSVVVAGSESISAGTTPGPDSDDESGGSGPSCESEGGALAWILCPVIETVISTLDNVVAGPLQDLLRYDSLTTDTSESNKIFQVWQNFVRIANILFIAAFMIIIFSQALSINIDAYTVRKMLPRVVIGIILVQLSYYMMAFMVDLFNVLGAGIAGLILAPIQGMPTMQALITPVLDDTSGGAAFTNILGGALAVSNLAALTSAAAGLLWALVALLPTILFIILAVVVTLILRKALIAACIVFAPIALVAWILPNTERVFRQWGEFFIKGLFMYPLIMGMLAIGKFAGALIVADGDIQEGSGDVFNTVAALIVNVIFYLLILLAWRVSDRVMRGVGGMFLKARGFRGIGAGGGGGGGGRGGGGAPTGGFRGRVNAARTRWAAGQGRAAQGRFNPLRMASQKPKGWTLNPLKGFRPGQLRPSNLRANPRQALAGAFGNTAPFQQRRAAVGAAEEQFNMLVAGAGKRLEDSGLSKDRDAMEALRLGKRGVAALRARGRDADANRIEQVQQRYASLMRPEYQLAAAAASLPAARDPGAGAPIEDSDVMIAYQVIADMFRSDPHRAESEVQKLAGEAGKNGRALQSTFAYDGNALNPDGSRGRVRMVAGRAGPTTYFTDDRQEAMQNHVLTNSAGDLSRTHSGSAQETATALAENLRTGYTPPASTLTPGEVQTTSAQRLGELLATKQLDADFRRHLETVYAGLPAGSPTQLEAQQTARRFGAII
jgi:hypothetical protein